MSCLEFFLRFGCVCGCVCMFCVVCRFVSACVWDILRGCVCVCVEYSLLCFVCVCVVVCVCFVSYFCVYVCVVVRVWA